MTRSDRDSELKVLGFRRTEQWSSSVHVVHGCNWPSFSGPINCRLRISFPNNTGNTAVQILRLLDLRGTLGDGKACEDLISKLVWYYQSVLSKTFSDQSLIRLRGTKHDASFLNAYFFGRSDQECLLVIIQYNAGII